MKETIKRKIIFTLILLTIASGPVNLTLGLYFGVLTNVLINAFWNSKLFPKKAKTDQELITEIASPPIID